MRRHTLMLILMVWLSAIAVTGVAGCSNSNNNSGNTSPNNGGTMRGNDEPGNSSDGPGGNSDGGMMNDGGSGSSTQTP